MNLLLKLKHKIPLHYNYLPNFWCMHIEKVREYLQPSVAKLACSAHRFEFILDFLQTAKI